jgi:hypothetical protein
VTDLEYAKLLKATVHRVERGNSAGKGYDVVTSSGCISCYTFMSNIQVDDRLMRPSLCHSVAYHGASKH